MDNRGRLTWSEGAPKKRLILVGPCDSEDAVVDAGRTGVSQIPKERKSDKVADAVRAIVNKVPSKLLPAPEFEILVDYNLRLDQMITIGHYDWTNSDITAKRFPVKGEGKVSRKAHLIHLNRDLSSEDVIRELDGQGKRPATIEELLAFGAKYPEIQCQFPVVALGSSAEAFGFRCVASLCRDDSGRYIRLGYWVGDWPGFCRFLVVNK